jgi:hypothetical protein
MYSASCSACAFYTWEVLGAFLRLPAVCSDTQTKRFKVQNSRWPDDGERDRINLFRIARARKRWVPRRCRMQTFGAKKWGEYYCEPERDARGRVVHTAAANRSLRVRKINRIICLHQHLKDEAAQANCCNALSVSTAANYARRTEQLVIFRFFAQLGSWKRVRVSANR